VHEFPIRLMGAITSRLKSLDRMDVTDKRRPQDGRVKTKTLNGSEVEMRLSTVPLQILPSITLLQINRECVP
jgi:general secretion pathway protein E